jgi:hypothetical protein
MDPKLTKRQKAIIFQALDTIADKFGSDPEIDALLVLLHPWRNDQEIWQRALELTRARSDSD